ncbi:MAG: hypothetical protein ABDI20_01050 [Candidatus Bipolaricaulaceae bacterium]
MSIWAELSPEALPGLARVRRLLERLGHPEAGLAAVHVAGAHGKTSVIVFLESILRAAGVPAGALTSSDPRRPWEAARLAGEPVARERLEALVAGAVRPWGDFVDVGRPTPQEAVFAAALAHFAAAGAALVLLERSLGGPWDPTNCVRSQLSLLTHVAPPENAEWEVQGLVQPGVPLLTTADEALVALAEACRATGAALSLVDPEDVELLELRWERAVWRSRSDPFSLGPFETPFLGAYQAPNLAVALAACAELLGGLGLSRRAVREGLAQVSLPGRFELVHRAPWVILDAAPSVAAAQALHRALERLPYLAGRRYLLLAHPSATLAQDMLATLRPAFSWAREVAPAELPGAAQSLASRLGEEDLLLVVAPFPALWEVRRVFAAAP